MQGGEERRGSYSPEAPDFPNRMCQRTTAGHSVVEARHVRFRHLHTLAKRAWRYRFAVRPGGSFPPSHTPPPFLRRLQEARSNYVIIHVRGRSTRLPVGRQKARQQCVRNAIRARQTSHTRTRHTMHATCAGYQNECRAHGVFSRKKRDLHSRAPEQ